ncbi:hypothetical protein [Novosphingobium ginsenosidimutans]|uniref:Valyl-tRNA synthetase n=1 Tax=Novosphingobium ginsenosidimutans TaxID=1176536 RepID=A0A5B8S4H2_9SPHN|nr:hypothetical protein [Novosphingobium ginsenosidimutans]QEA16263.1 hypothetical protein FRF71_09030 [Novosphingobium ginsenosidimutans]
MKLYLLPLALLAAPLSAQANAPTLSPELQTGLRCAALFSVVAAEQARMGARDWPPITARGREFFVRVSARAMDAGKLDRPALQALMRSEVAAVRKAETRAALKAPCLAMLDANIPPTARRP